MSLTRQSSKLLRFCNTVRFYLWTPFITYKATNRFPFFLTQLHNHVDHPELSLTGGSSQDQIEVISSLLEKNFISRYIFTMFELIKSQREWVDDISKDTDYIRMIFFTIEKKGLFFRFIPVFDGRYF